MSIAMISSSQAVESSERTITLVDSTSADTMASVSLKQFAEKVIAITEAARGVGRAVAVYLANRGASLAISDVQVDALTELSGEPRAAGARVDATVMDARNPGQVRERIENIVMRVGS